MTKSDEDIDDSFEKLRAAHEQQRHCKRGHEFTPENTTWRYGHRACKKCRAIAETARRKASPGLQAAASKKWRESLSPEENETRLTKVREQQRARRAVEKQKENS